MARGWAESYVMISAADFVRDRVGNQVRANEVKLTEGAHFGAGNFLAGEVNVSGGGLLRPADARSEKTDEHDRTRDMAQRRQHVNSLDPVRE